MAENIKLIVLGSGGHAKVLVDTLRRLGQSVWGCTTIEPFIEGDKVLCALIRGNDDLIVDFEPTSVRLINGIGSASVTNQTRAKVFHQWKKKGFQFISIIHSSSIVSEDVVIGEGVQILAGAIVQPGCVLGDNVIINTKASVDHDCIIGNNVHVAPGVTISGDVKIGDNSFIGIGATVIQGISIGSNAMVAAGAVVVRDVADNATVKGVPAVS